MIFVLCCLCGLPSILKSTKKKKKKNPCLGSASGRQQLNTLRFSPKLCHLISGHVAPRRVSLCFPACLIMSKKLGREVMDKQTEDKHQLPLDGTACCCSSRTRDFIFHPQLPTPTLFFFPPWVACPECLQLGS